MSGAASKTRISANLLAAAALAALCFACAVLIDPTDIQIISLTSKLIIIFAAALISVIALIKLSHGIRNSISLVIAAASGVALIGVTLFFIDNVRSPVVMLGVLGLLIIGYYAVVLEVTGKMTCERAIWLLIAAGFLLRLCYGLYTGVETRQHDVESFGNDIGHAGYILYLFENKHLPDFDPTTVWQYYHPPLSHILSAVWLDVAQFLNFTWARSLEGLQFLPLFYSSVGMLACRSIFKRLNLHNGALVAAMAVVCFAPPFIILSGAVNNDMLSIMFILAAIAATLKWCQTHRLTDIIFIALFIGLGMSTKLSVAYIAPAVAVVFLLELVRSTGKRWRLIGSYAVFGVICVPLGLWWPIRNSLLFGSPINYVPMLSENSYQFVGNYTFVQRFLLPLNGCWKSEFISFDKETIDYNVWSGLFKTAAFDEYNIAASSPAANGFTDVLFYVGILLGLVAFGSMMYFLFKSRDRLGSAQKLLLYGGYALILGSYLIFCATFRHTCTMNIRYATPLIVIGALFLGLLAERLSNACQNGSTAAKIAKISLYFVISVFCASSAVVYLLLGA